MKPDEFKNKFDEALRARDRGATDEGVRLLEELLSTGMHRAAVLGTLGMMLIYEKQDPVRAMPILRDSVAASPKSERASIAFFHSLVGIGRMDEALAEAQRFLAIRSSDEYEQLLLELKGTGQEKK